MQLQQAAGHLLHLPPHGGLRLLQAPVGCGPRQRKLRLTLPMNVLCQQNLWAACIILGPVVCSRCNELLPLTGLKDASRLQARGVDEW